jgi:hypothetical protein
VEAIHGILPVFFDCLFADLEDIGDFLVGMSFGDKADHFHFALGACLFPFGPGGRLGEGLEQGR